MKTRLISPNRVPRGGVYEINRPDLGMAGTGYLLDVLINSITAYRKANSIPIGLDFANEVERVVCETYPDECEVVGMHNIRNRHLGIGDVILGSRVMLSLWASGGHLVSRQEAERRAAICVKCPYNAQFTKPCTGICAELKDAVSGIIDHQGTAYDENLKSCMICGCFNQAAIWIPLALQTTPLSDEQRAQFESVPNCWKKTSLLQEQL